MTKSYRVKIYPNKRKEKKINSLLSYWQDQVNHKIKTFWEFEKIEGSYPPKDFREGGRLINDATLKAWQIVKGAKRNKYQKRPYFQGNEIDLNEASARLIRDFQTKEFDLWFSVISLEKRNRLKLPAKKTEALNKALEAGKSKRSFKLLKVDQECYLELFVDFPEVQAKENKKVVGIDVGLSNAIATSDGNFLGRELKDLRIRTKWRKYVRKLSPIKQRLNHYAKKLVNLYPNCDFAVEDLFFKGKKRRSRTFRRRNSTWAYKHLTKQLEQLALLEGFQVFRVSPEYTSQQCPVCGFILRENRQGELFLCQRCGLSGHADHIGAINIARKSIEEFPSLQLVLRNNFL